MEHEAARASIEHETVEPESAAPERTESEPQTNVESSSPFSQPRYDPFEFDRNDDIEVIKAFE
jgi:hypothetical protein